MSDVIVGDNINEWIGAYVEKCDEQSGIPQWPIKCQIYGHLQHKVNEIWHPRHCKE